MRHGRRGRKLGRTASHKKAMLNNMAASLFVHGSIRTTYSKAKELRSMAERLITFARRGDLHARRQVLKRIRNKVVVSKLFDEIGPGVAERQGGYTRVLKLGPRQGDSSEICLVELVGDELRHEGVGRLPSRTGPPPSPQEKETAEEAAAEGMEQAGAKESDGTEKEGS